MRLEVWLNCTRGGPFTDFSSKGTQSYGSSKLLDRCQSSTRMSSRPKLVVWAVHRRFEAGICIITSLVTVGTCDMTQVAWDLFALFPIRALNCLDSVYGRARGIVRFLASIASLFFLSFRASSEVSALSERWGADDFVSWDYDSSTRGSYINGP